MKKEVPLAGRLSTLSAKEKEEGGCVPYCLDPSWTEILRRNLDGVPGFYFSAFLCRHESVDDVVELVRDSMASETQSDSDAEGLEGPNVLHIVRAIDASMWGRGLVRALYYTPGYWQPRWSEGADDKDHILIDEKLAKYTGWCTEEACLVDARRWASNPHVNPIGGLQGLDWKYGTFFAGKTNSTAAWLRFKEEITRRLAAKQEQAEEQKRAG
jgi:hypothetical protein